MNARLFKPGDRVVLKAGGPVMIVHKYAREHKPWVGWINSDNTVQCSWFEKDGTYQKGIFHQNSLTRATQSMLFLKGGNQTKFDEIRA